MDLGLRVKVALAFCGLVILAVGVTGTVLVVDSASYQEQQLVERELLLAQNRALAMQTRIGVLLRELARLSRTAEMKQLDGDAAEKLLLGAAHRRSVLFTTGVLLVDRFGRVVHTEPRKNALWPAQTDLRSQDWWTRTIDATTPFSFALVEQGKAILSAVAPVRDSQMRFAGALIGIVELRNLLGIGSDTKRRIARGGDAAVVDEHGRVLVWWSGAEPGVVRELAGAIHGPPGTLRSGAMLYSHAPVGETGVSALVSVPWASLTEESSAQIHSVVIMLVAGTFLAVVIALFLSSRVTRPVLALAAQADALSSKLAATAVAETGRDELDTLRRAFAALQRALAERDRRIAHDMEEIRNIAADRERLNVELRQLADELASRVEERTSELREAQRALLATERLATIGKTAGALAHELRNALNGLSVATDLLAQAAGERSSPMVRERAYREVSRLRDLTESLLSFSGTPRLLRTREDLHELLRRAVNNHYEDLRDQDITLELDLAQGGEPLFVECDAAKIVTVLGNLIRNAIEATMAARHAAGEDAAEVPRPVAVRTTIDGEANVRVEVVDHGVGISAEAKARLFEPFFTTKRTGTGLGLVTSQRFVQAHGGDLFVGDGDRGETRFVVVLPRVGPDQGGAEPFAEALGGARATGEVARARLQRAS